MRPASAAGRPGRPAVAYSATRPASSTSGTGTHRTCWRSRARLRDRRLHDYGRARSAAEGEARMCAFPEPRTGSAAPNLPPAAGSLPAPPTPLTRPGCRHRPARPVRRWRERRPGHRSAGLTSWWRQAVLAIRQWRPPPRSGRSRTGTSASSGTASAPRPTGGRWRRRCRRSSHRPRMPWPVRAAR